MTRTYTTMVAALAVVLLAYSPAQAILIGFRPAEQPWTLQVVNQSNGSTAVTVYELDSRGRLDAIDIFTVAVVEERNFPGPRRDIKRIVIDVEPPAGGRATASINGGAPITCDGDTRLTFVVVE